MISYIGIELGHLRAALEEESIPQLHDVGLVHTRHLLAAVSGGVIECKLCNPVGLSGSYNLEALHHPRHRLVLNARIFSLGLLSGSTLVTNNKLLFKF